MDRSFKKNGLRMAAVLVIAALIAPVADAQISLGGPALATLQAKPVALRAESLAQKSYQSNMNQMLIGPGPIFAATTTNLFAQVAFGGGFTTVFSFMNTGPDVTTGILYLTDNSGQPLAAAFSSPGASDALGPSYPITVPSGGSQEITADALNPAKDATSVGWARVESSGGSLGGVATFQLTAGGTLAAIVGVLSAPATSSATIAVNDDHSQARDTGYAIANPGSTPINVKIVLVHPDGTVHQTISPPALNPLPAGGHISTFLWQDTNDTFLLFRGSMVLIEQTGKPFSVVALVLKNGLFTAIPVIPGNAPGIK